MKKKIDAILIVVLVAVSVMFSFFNIVDASSLPLPPRIIAGVKNTVTYITIPWLLEYPNQGKGFYAQGLYWLFYRPYGGGFGNCVTDCLVFVYGNGLGPLIGATAPQEQCGDAYGSGLNGPYPAESLSIDNNSTNLWLVCDNGTRTGAGAGGPFAGFTGLCCDLWFQQGRVFPNGTIHFGSQVQIGQTILNGNAHFANEVVRKSTTGRFFVYYTLENDTTHLSYPYVTQSSDSTGSSWSAPLQLSTTGCSVLGGAGGDWEGHLFVMPQGRMSVLYAADTGDPICKNTAANRVLEDKWTNAGGWGAVNQASVITDRPDYLGSTDDNGGGLAWIETPTPGNNNAPTNCIANAPGYTGVAGTYQDCYAATWLYNDTLGTWSNRSLLDSAHTQDEHGQLFFDKTSNALYWMWEDILCINSVVPTIYLYKAATIGGSGWSSVPYMIIAVPNSPKELTGGSNGSGCSGASAAGCGCFAAMMRTFTSAQDSSVTSLGFSWLETRDASSWFIEYDTLTFLPVLPPLLTEPKKVLFLDDFINANPLLSSSWTIDNYAASGNVPGEYTSAGFAAMVAQSSSSVETIHVSTPAAYSPSAYSDNMIVKRKLTASLFPFQKKEANTGNIKIGMAGLLTTGAYPSTGPQNTPYVDLNNNCASNGGVGDNVGADYIVMDNNGTVTTVSCANGNSNRVILGSGLDPTLYTVFTVETSGLFCSVCAYKTFTGTSWVWSRVYQNDKNGNIISSTDQSYNLTNSLLQAPLFQTTYIFISLQNGNGAATHQTSYIDLVQLQNYGSPVCLFGCLPPVIEVGNLPPALSSIWAGLVNLAAALGQGDIGFGSMILFGIFTLPVILTYAAIRSTMLVASEFLAILGLLMASGLFGSIWVFGVVLSMGYLAFGIIKKMFLSGGMGGGGSGEGDG